MTFITIWLCLGILSVLSIIIEYALHHGYVKLNVNDIPMTLITIVTGPIILIFILYKYK